MSFCPVGSLVLATGRLSLVNGQRPLYVERTNGPSFCLLRLVYCPQTLRSTHGTVTALYDTPGALCLSVPISATWPLTTAVHLSAPLHCRALQAPSRALTDTSWPASSPPCLFLHLFNLSHSFSSALDSLQLHQKHNCLNFMPKN